MDSKLRQEVTVVICDDDVLACRALKLLLQDSAIKVLAACTSAEECLDVISKTPPHVAVVDLQFGSDPKRGIELIQSIRTASPTTLCLVLTATDAKGKLLPEAFLAGAHGFHRKGYLSGPALAGIVKRMATGDWEIDHELARALVDWVDVQPTAPTTDAAPICLMSTELRVLQRIAAGDSTQTIAHALDLPSTAVKGHMRNITNKYHRAGSAVMHLCFSDTPLDATEEGNDGRATTVTSLGGVHR